MTPYNIPNICQIMEKKASLHREKEEDNFFIEIISKVMYIKSGPKYQLVPCGVVGNTVGFHPATPGSIPGKELLFFVFIFFFFFFTVSLSEEWDLCSFSGSSLCSSRRLQFLRAPLSMASS